jgi:hypothetical protein
MNDKYDLEQAIMLAWQTSEDLDLLYKHHGDHPVVMTEDEVGNALWGIKILHEMRMEKLMDTYCRKFELNQYCTDPDKLAARNALFGEAHDFLNETKPKKKGKKK